MIQKYKRTKIGKSKMVTFDMSKTMSKAVEQLKIGRVSTENPS